MENTLEKLLSELIEFKEMLESDRRIKGKYELSLGAKRYSVAIQEEIEEIIINNGGELED